NQTAAAPASKLESHILERAAQPEAARAMQLNRTEICRISDHGNHLPKLASLGLLDQPLEQRATDPAPLRLRRYIDRILDAESVSGAQTIRHGIGIADDRCIVLSHQKWVAAGTQSVIPPSHLHLIGRIDFKRRGAELHGVLVDAGNCAEIAHFSAADEHDSGDRRLRTEDRKNSSEAETYYSR